MEKIMRDCDALLNTLAVQQNEIGEEARNISETFGAIKRAVKQQAVNIPIADVLNLAEKFFRTTAQIYTLAAMAGVQLDD